MARIKRMASKSDILKFSDEDLDWFGLEGSHDDLAAYWLQQGAKLVVITKGAEGASGYTRERKVTVPSQRVTVVDTVGAGDTFDAGVLASLKIDDLLTKAKVASLSEKPLHNASRSARRPLRLRSPAPAPILLGRKKSASETGSSRSRKAEHFAVEVLGPLQRREMAYF